MYEKIIIPNKEEPYLAVWQTEKKLCIEVKKSKQNYLTTIELDKNILPDLVDALIDIQNQPS